MLNNIIILQVPSDNTVPIVSIIVSGTVSLLVAYISIRNNTKMIFIQANKDKINETILKLALGAQRGKLDEINDVMNSIDNYYIPDDLKKRIKKEIEKENPTNWYYKISKNKDKLFKRIRNEKYPSLCDRILSLINKYISP